jgi:hypothetical protein
VRARVRAGANSTGGIVGYPLEALYGEVAFVAYHFHWAPDDILNMEHADRRRWVAEISRINGDMNDAERGT